MDKEKQKMIATLVLQKHIETEPDFVMVLSSKDGKVSFDLTESDNIGHFLFCTELLKKSAKDTFERFLVNSHKPNDPVNTDIREVK